MNLYDGFVNLFKGLGGKKDVTKYANFISGVRINQPLANALYTYSWLCAKLVDIKVDDATRKWRSLLIEDIDKKAELEKAYDDWGVRQKIVQACKWSRVFGGAAIVVVLNDDPTKPMNPESIKKNSLLNLVVLDKYNIFAEAPNRNILDRNFGQPDFYRIVRSGTLIHHSRVIRFDGIIPTMQEWEQENYWGLSILTRLFDPISAAEEVISLIRNLVYEAKIDVYKISGLNELIAAGEEELARKRIEFAQQSKSILNGIALDKEDDYDQKSQQFANLQEVDDRFAYKVCGAGDVPFTRVYGRSPGGLNATGDSDLINYYDTVQSYQESIASKLDILDKIMLQNLGYEGDWGWEWNPIKQLTELEQSTLSKTNADRDKIYVDMGVIETTDILKELENKGTYCSLDKERVEELMSNNDLMNELNVENNPT